MINQKQLRYLFLEINNKEIDSESSNHEFALLILNDEIFVESGSEFSWSEVYAMAEKLASNFGVPIYSLKWNEEDLRDHGIELFSVFNDGYFKANSILRLANNFKHEFEKDDRGTVFKPKPLTNSGRELYNRLAESSDISFLLAFFTHDIRTELETRGFSGNRRNREKVVDRMASYYGSSDDLTIIQMMIQDLGEAGELEERSQFFHTAY